MFDAYSTASSGNRRPRLQRSMGAALAKPAIRERVWSEHAGILCVLAGDGVGAEEAARRHTERAGQEVARTI